MIIFVLNASWSKSWGSQKNEKERN